MIRGPVARTRRWPLALALSLGCALAAPAAAQTLWHPDPASPSLRVEWLHPDIEDADDVDVGDFAAFVTLNLEISDDVMLVVDVPYARVSSEDGSAAEDPSVDFEGASMIGNPYVGVSFGGDDGGDLVLELGTRLPLGEDDELAPLLLGATTGIHRVEAFLPDVFTGYAALAWRHALEDRDFRIRLRAGPTLVVDTSDDDDAIEDDDTDLLIDYLGQLWYVDDGVRFGGGLSGRLITTAEEGDLSERSVHQFDLLGSYDFGTFEPGLNLRFPFDTESPIDVSHVIGLWLTVEL